MSHKSSINALLTGALLVAGSVAFAQTTTDLTPLAVGVYPTKQAEKICLSVEKQPNTLAFVQLLAPTGEELYHANLPKKGTSFRQVFNLNEMKDGIYTLRIKQGATVIMKSIYLRTNAPELTQPMRSLTLGN